MSYTDELFDNNFSFISSFISLHNLVPRASYLFDIGKAAKKALAQAGRIFDLIG